MFDKIDELVFELEKNPNLSARDRDILRECISNHPRGRGKPNVDRVDEIRFAVGGRKIPAHLRFRVARFGLAADQARVKGVEMKL